MTGKNLVENLFGIQGFDIAWYGVIITFGMILGTLLACRSIKKEGINPDVILDFVLFGIPLSIVGARIYYVVFEWDAYKDNLTEIFKIRNGGLAIYGGVIAGVITAFVFCKVKKIPFFKFVDIAIPSLVLGQAIGRWGNFTNQEAFGELVTNTKMQFFPYAVFIDRLGEWHQATFFYESIMNVILFILLILYKNKKKFDGELLSIYLMGYGLIRTVVEGFRTDSLYLIPGVRVSQVLSMVFVIVGIGFFIFGRKKLTITEYKGKYAL